ncbi:hypothetical protein ACSV9I_08080 [Rhizobium sp. G187]|uniref:hypothetical protein n=1 Tax=Rhizobium sp. G187 TaxID=3451352 RepID=UPI003EE48B92
MSVRKQHSSPNGDQQPVVPVVPAVPRAPQPPRQGKASMPAVERPDPTDFTAELIGSDAIILDHLAR